MARMARNTRLLALAAGLAITLPMTFAAAQPAERSSGDAPLRGPRVVESDEPAGRFGSGTTRQGQDRQAQRSQQANTLQTYARMLRVLASERAPEQVRLTEAQQDVIRPIMEAHGRELSAYYTQHKDKLIEAATLLGNEQLIARLQSAETIDARTVQSAGAQLRSRAQSRAGDRRSRPDRARNQNDDMDAMEMAEDGDRSTRRDRPQFTDEQREGMRMLGEIRQAAPSAEATLTKVKVVLTDEQRSFIEDRIGRTQRAERGGQASRAAASAVKSQRLARVLESMTEEEQEQLATMIERRRQAREAGDQPRRRRSEL